MCFILIQKHTGGPIDILGHFPTPILIYAEDRIPNISRVVTSPFMWYLLTLNLPRTEYLKIPAGQ